LVRYFVGMSFRDTFRGKKISHNIYLWRSSKLSASEGSRYCL
jgi:hypothetical protein